MIVPGNAKKKKHSSDKLVACVVTFTLGVVLATRIALKREFHGKQITDSKHHAKTDIVYSSSSASSSAASSLFPSPSPSSS